MKLSFAATSKYSVLIRDDGYGSMTTKQKEKCSAPIRVEDQSRSRHNLVSISADVPESGSVGETVPIVCNARNVDIYHSLRLMVNGRTLREEMRWGCQLFWVPQSLQPFQYTIY